jgi:metal-responsive CopG/Arc/MetJ family transcriptional regulator
MWVIIHMMKTVQVTIDETLLKQVDAAARKLGAGRSEFTRRALRAALDTMRTEELESRQRAGYLKRPVGKGEFDVWDREHVWGDE